MAGSVMIERRIGIDANLLIAAWSGRHPWCERAVELLADDARQLIVSDLLWLEVLPKALYHRRPEEAAFYRGVFARAEYQSVNPAVTDQAKQLAERHGLAAMDALHLAVALEANADAFVSGERPDKPMFRVTELPVISLWSPRP